MIILTDIHGNFDTMMALLDMIPEEEKAKGIAICGDLIDRGPKSKQVVQWAIDNKAHVVRGNHEDMMLQTIMSDIGYMKKNNNIPQGNYTFETYCSYEIFHEDDLDERGIPRREIQTDLLLDHALWMDKLPYYIEFPDIKNDEGRYLVISHSLINNVWKMRNTTNEAEMKRFNKEISWGRPHTVNDVPEIYNVFGHTIQDHGPRIRKIYSCIDTGCFYVQDKSNGRLTALQFPEMIIYEHENIDMRKPENPFKNILTPEDVKKRKKAKYIKP